MQDPVEIDKDGCDADARQSQAPRSEMCREGHVAPRPPPPEGRRPGTTGLNRGLLLHWPRGHQETRAEHRLVDRSSV
jgi:hypothetical protein